MVEDSHIERLREFFTDAEIVEINAVVAFYGFLNRWNDSMATDLEAIPVDVGNRLLSESGWAPGKHKVEAAE